MHFFKKFEIYLLGITFSLILISVSSGLKILNPTNSSWLTVGDGIQEISWEFFRDQPIFQFPLGLNPKYGLEISSTIAFDGQVPILSLILHPFNLLLTERFQYFGIFLFLNFALNYIFASKIFIFFKMNQTQVILNSIILSLSPVILNRFIENTHYNLTSAWLIFWGILLYFERKPNFFQWLILFNIAVLINFYFIIFLIGIYIAASWINLLKKILKIKNILTHVSVIVLSIVTNMYTVGFFYGNVKSQDIGYGIFKTSLISLFDPTGWSRIIRDLPETQYGYEGFSYVGIGSLLIILFTLFKIKKLKSFSKFNAIQFTPIFTVSILLFLYSLSNKIAFGDKELFEFKVPEIFQSITDSFRSSGRFSWLLVFVIFIYFTYLAFKFYATNFYSTILVGILVITLFDIWPKLTSEKNSKFQNFSSTNLKDISWNDINQCYKKIRIYPPTPAVDNVYNFLVMANKQNLAINTGRFGRFSKSSLDYAFANVHKKFRAGNLDSDSFYIFSNSEFTPPELVDFYKNLALRTINYSTGWGELDGYTFLAPDLINCPSAYNLKKNIRNFGPEVRYQYGGETLIFGIDKNSDKFALTASVLGKDYLVTQDSSTIITISLAKNFLPKEIRLTGKLHDNNYSSFEFKININDDFTYTCNFSKVKDTCIFRVQDLAQNSHILNIQVIPNSSGQNSNNPKLEISELRIS